MQLEKMTPGTTRVLNEAMPIAYGRMQILVKQGYSDCIEVVAKVILYNEKGNIVKKTNITLETE